MLAKIRGLLYDAYRALRDYGEVLSEIDSINANAIQDMLVEIHDARGALEKWQTIPDDKVLHIWKCTQDDCEAANGEEANPEVAVNPNFYQESGEPVCGACDADMEYQRTDIHL
jgi:hypothetical protein